MTLVFHYFFIRNYMTDTENDNLTKENKEKIVSGENSKKKKYVVKEKKTHPPKKDDNFTSCFFQSECFDNIKNTDTFKAINKNKETYLLFLFCILVLSGNNFPKGILTFVVGFWWVWWAHYSAHKKRNVITVCHHYHHEHTNWFAHWIEIVLESQYLFMLPLLNESFLDNLFDKWVIIMLVLYYITVHNYNYSVLHVNKTHELHHEDKFTNMGPDIVDVICGTKNQRNKDEDDYFEDIQHYTPNIIYATIVTVILKKLLKNKCIKFVFDILSYIILFVLSIILIVASWYLWIFVEPFRDTNGEKKTGFLQSNDRGMLDSIFGDMSPDVWEPKN